MCCNGVEDSFDIFKDDAVLETERGDALGFQVGITPSILLHASSGVVRFAIEFDCELDFVAVEIEEVIAELVLATEFQIAALPVAEQFPQQFLGGRLLLPQLTCPFLQPGEVVAAAIVPTPFSLWEKGWG